MVVRWVRRGDRIDLRPISHETTADEGASLHIAVENSNLVPVLASPKIDGWEGQDLGRRRDRPLPPCLPPNPASPRVRR